MNHRLFEKLALRVTAIAHWLHRRPGEDRSLEDPWAIYAKAALVVALISPFAGIFAYYSSKRVAEWNRIRPLVKVELKDWKVVYGGPAACDTQQGVVAVDCPAHPRNPLLWESGSSKADPDHAERVRALRGKAGLWVGAQLSLPRDLTERQFVIGYIAGTYEVFLNGRVMLKGVQTSDSVPQSISLEQDQNWIAIHLLTVPESAFPDIFNRSFGGEGIFTQEDVFALTTLESFSFQARPIAFGLAQGIIGLLFFFFWWSAKRKQEYFYLAIFVLAHMCIQIRLFDVVYCGWTQAFGYRVDFFLRTLEGLFALALGLSFARVRPAVFQLSFSGGLFVAILPFIFWSWAPIDVLQLSKWIGQIWVVPAYVMGSLACLIQAAAMSIENQNEQGVLTIRARRLLFFGVDLSLLAGLYYLNSQHVLSSSHYVYWYRFGHLGLILFLAGIVISEYREQAQFVQRAKLSKYITSLKPDESRQVEGTLLRVDLKRSKILEAEAAAKGIGFGYGTITSAWLASMCEVIFRSGGEILSERGDEFIAFFDELGFPHCQELIERILLEMMHRNRGLESALGLNEKDLQFRATLVTGQLWVGWKGRIPGYSGDVMAESARVLDLEKKIGSKTQSLLVIDPAQCRVFPFGKGRLAVSPQVDNEGMTRQIGWADLEKVRAKALIAA